MKMIPDIPMVSGLWLWERCPRGCWSSGVLLPGSSFVCPLLLAVFQTRAAGGGRKGAGVGQPGSQR